MAGATPVPLLRLVLEDDDLRTAKLLLDFCLDGCPGHERRADPGRPVAADHEHPIERDVRTRLDRTASQLRAVSPTATRYCLPPVSMMAYGAAARTRVRAFLRQHGWLLWLGARSCFGHDNLRSLFRTGRMETRDPCNAKSGCVNAPATGEYTISQWQTVPDGSILDFRDAERRRSAAVKCLVEPGGCRTRITVIGELGGISLAKDRTTMTFTDGRDEDRDRGSVFTFSGVRWKSRRRRGDCGGHVCARAWSPVAAAWAERSDAVAESSLTGRPEFATLEKTWELIHEQWPDPAQLDDADTHLWRGEGHGRRNR